MLGFIYNLTPLKPFHITSTAGTTKPSNLEFLNEAINDLNNLIINGININDEHFNIRILNIIYICDAPAKAFVKCVNSLGILDVISVSDVGTILDG